MVPTARVVVYYLSGQPEEIVVDSLTFFVDGTANNKVGHYFVAEIQFMHWTSSCYKRGWGGINIYMYNPENTSIQTDVWFVYMWFSTFMLTIVQSIIWYKKAVLGSILVLWHWALFFFKVGAQVNRGKDFTRDTVEILATADPGAYVAFAAIPLDLYKRGLNDGLNHWTVSI